MDWLMDRARRGRQAVTDEVDTQDRVGTIMGFPDVVPDPPDIVGWMEHVAGSVKGANHRCLACSPRKPGKGRWDLVTRERVAATARCGRCGIVLEQVPKKK